MRGAHLWDVDAGVRRDDRLLRRSRVRGRAVHRIGLPSGGAAVHWSRRLLLEYMYVENVRCAA